jgi:hypothetical protein
VAVRDRTRQRQGASSCSRRAPTTSRARRARRDRDDPVHGRVRHGSPCPAGRRGLPHRCPQITQDKQAETAWPWRIYGMQVRDRSEHARRSRRLVWRQGPPGPCRQQIGAHDDGSVTAMATTCRSCHKQSTASRLAAASGRRLPPRGCSYRSPRAGCFSANRCTRQRNATQRRDRHFAAIGVPMRFLHTRAIPSGRPRRCVSSSAGFHLQRSRSSKARPLACCDVARESWPNTTRPRDRRGGVTNRVTSRTQHRLLPSKRHDCSPGMPDMLMAVSRAELGSVIPSAGRPLRGRSP